MILWGFNYCQAATEASLGAQANPTGAGSSIYTSFSLSLRTSTDIWSLGKGGCKQPTWLWEQENENIQSQQTSGHLWLCICCTDGNRLLKNRGYNLAKFSQIIGSRALTQRPPVHFKCLMKNMKLSEPVKGHSDIFNHGQTCPCPSLTP